MTINYMAEPDDSQYRFKLSFDEMQHHECVDVLLQRAMHHVLSVPELREVVEEWMNQEWSNLAHVVSVEVVSLQQRECAHIQPKKLCASRSEVPSPSLAVRHPVVPLPTPHLAFGRLPVVSYHS